MLEKWRFSHVYINDIFLFKFKIFHIYLLIQYIYSKSYWPFFNITSSFFQFSECGFFSFFLFFFKKPFRFSFHTKLAHLKDVMSTNPWILRKLLGCRACWSQVNRLMYIIHDSYTIKIIILLIVQQCNFPCFFNPFFHWKRPIVNVDSHPKAKYINTRFDVSMCEVWWACLLVLLYENNF